MPKHGTAEDQLTQLVETWVRGIVGLFVDPFAMSENDGEATDFRSMTFTAKAAATTRTLELTGDLVPGIGRTGSPKEALPVKCVRFDPPQLGSNETSFRLIVDAASSNDHPGATYWGNVNVNDSSTLGTGGLSLSSSVETVRVWIVIP
jgi:hypothetical protein